MPGNFQSGSSRVVIYRTYQRTRLARYSNLCTRRYLNFAQYFERSEIAHLRGNAQLPTFSTAVSKIQNTHAHSLARNVRDSRVSQSQIGANSKLALGTTGT
jgi:hypothetical protein